MSKCANLIKILPVLLWLITHNVFAVENPDDYYSIHLMRDNYLKRSDSPNCEFRAIGNVNNPLNHSECFETRTGFQEKYNVNDALSACEIGLRGDACTRSANEDDNKVHINHGGGGVFNHTQHRNRFKFFMPPGVVHVYWNTFTRTGTTAFAAISLDSPPEISPTVINNARQIASGKTSINNAIAHKEITPQEGSNRIGQLFNQYPVPITGRGEVIREVMPGQNNSGKQSVAIPIGEGGFFDLAAGIVPQLEEEETDQNFSNGRWVYVHIFENREGELFQWGLGTDVRADIYEPWYKCMADNGLFDEDGEPNDVDGICQQCINEEGDGCKAAKTVNQTNGISISSFTATKSNNGIQLSWQLAGAGVEKVSKLEVLRNDDIVHTITANAAVASIYFDDTLTLINGEQHNYQLRVFDATGVQLAESKANIIIDSKLSQPYSFELDQIGNTLKFTWSYIDDSNFERFLITRDGDKLGNEPKKMSTLGSVSQYILEDPIDDVVRDTTFKYTITAKAKDDESNDSELIQGSVEFKFKEPEITVFGPTKVNFLVKKEGVGEENTPKIIFIDEKPDFRYTSVSSEGFKVQVGIGSESKSELQWLKLYKDESAFSEYQEGQSLEGKGLAPYVYVDLYPKLDGDILASILSSDQPKVSKVLKFFNDDTKEVISEKEITVELNTDLGDEVKLSNAQTFEFNADLDNDIKLNNVQTVDSLRSSSAFVEGVDIKEEIRNLNTSNNQGLYLFVDFGENVLLSGIVGAHTIGTVSIELPEDLLGEFKNSGHMIVEKPLAELNPNQNPKSDVLFASKLSVVGEQLGENTASIDSNNQGQRITIRAGIDAKELAFLKTEQEEYSVYGWVTLDNGQGSDNNLIEIFESVLSFSLGHSTLCTDIDNSGTACHNGYVSNEYPLYKTKDISKPHIITLFDNTFAKLGNGIYRFYVAIKSNSSDTFHYKHVATVEVNKQE